jgi:hypothetical protein
MSFNSIYYMFFDRCGRDNGCSHRRNSSNNWILRSDDCSNRLYGCTDGSYDPIDVGKSGDFGCGRKKITWYEKRLISCLLSVCFSYDVVLNT